MYSVPALNSALETRSGVPNQSSVLKFANEVVRQLDIGWAAVTQQATQLQNLEQAGIQLFNFTKDAFTLHRDAFAKLGEVLSDTDKFVRNDILSHLKEEQEKSKQSVLEIAGIQRSLGYDGMYQSSLRAQAENTALLEKRIALLEGRNSSLDEGAQHSKTAMENLLKKVSKIEENFDKFKAELIKEKNPPIESSIKCTDCSDLKSLIKDPKTGLEQLWKSVQTINSKTIKNLFEKFRKLEKETADSRYTLEKLLHDLETKILKSNPNYETRERVIQKQQKKELITSATDISKIFDIFMKIQANKGPDDSKPKKKKNKNKKKRSKTTEPKQKVTMDLEHEEEKDKEPANQVQHQQPAIVKKEGIKKTGKAEPQRKVDTAASQNQSSISLNVPANRGNTLSSRLANSFIGNNKTGATKTFVLPGNSGSKITLDAHGNRQEPKDDKEKT